MASGQRAVGQQPVETLPGFKAENVLEARGIDNVSPFSGDPGVVLPIGPEYNLSIAFKWQLRAYYAVKFWNFPQDSCQDNSVKYAFVLGDPTVGVGWSLQLGYVSYDAFSPTGPWDFFSSDGGRHGFGLDASGTGLSSDGSHLRMKAVGGSGPQSPSYYTVEFPDGTTEFFEQQFLPPTPFLGTSPDFTNLGLFAETPTNRYGLTRVDDRFGKTVLKVNYDAGRRWQPTGIVLNPDVNGQGPTVVLHWSTTPGTSVSWWVVDYALFPAVGSSQRKVSFGYQLTSFNRSPYDNSNSSGNTNCPVSPGAVAEAPLLQSITYADSTFSSFVPFSYTFGYSSDTGALQQITLPTLGTIQYTYGYVSGVVSTCQPPCDPESGTFSAQLAPSTTVGPTILSFLNASLAAASRMESDPVTGKSSTTSYSRRLILPCTTVNCTEFDDSRIYRQVVVTAPGNDPPSGPTQFMTRSYFTVETAFPGLEVYRRSFADASGSGATIRTLIRCYDHSLIRCGYHDPSGNLQQYGGGLEPPQAEVTWYGAAPSGSDGGTCVGVNPPCTASRNDPLTWNDTVGQYGKNTLNSTLTGMPSGWLRTTATNWNPQTESKWMLDLISSRRVTDASTPAPNDVTKAFDFDPSNGFLRSTTVADNAYGARVDTFSQGTFGNPTTETVNGLSAASFVDTRTFDGHGLVLTSQRTGVAWKSFDVDRDTKTGQITRSRDANASLFTDYTYDALGRVTGIAPPGGDAPTTISYDLTTQTTVSRSGSDGNSTWQRYVYDSLGRLIREIRQMPSGFSVRTHGYDNAGHSNFVSEWGGCGDATGDCLTAAPAGTTSSNFDPFGRPQAIRRADGSVTTLDRTDTDAGILFSDSLESVTINVNGSASTTKTRHDALGRIVTVTEPDVGQGTENTTYTYNVLDKLAIVNQGSQTRTFTYDAFGFLRQETTPEKGAVTYGSYDSLGNVLSETLNDGTSVSRSFDPVGRPCKLAAGSGGQVYGLTFYDGSGSCGPETDPNGAFGGGAFPNGKLTRRYGYNPASTPSLGVTDEFDYSGSAGLVAVQTTRFDSGAMSAAAQSWLYNSLGLVNQHAHYRPSGAPFIVNAIYSQGLPTAVYANGLPVVTGVTYQPSGALGSYTTGPGIGLNIATTIAPDTSGMPRPSRISAQPVGPYPNLFDTFSYAYDGAGNITGMGSDAFTYDARSRLCQAFLAPAGATQYYTYDRYGNLVTKGFTQPPPPSPCLATSSWANNRVPTATYDLGVSNGRGNLTSYAGSSYSYDGLDRQVAASGWTYLFDGASERVAKYNGAWTYTFRDEGNRLSTEFAGSAPSRDNVFLGNLLVASFADPAVGGNGRVWTFYSSDHLGTPRLLTDVSGNLIETRQNWPYGEDISVPGASQRIRFASMERDTEAPAYHDHARNHEFNLGRFLSPDSLEGYQEDPRSWNRYAYAAPNPLTHLDPNGLETTVYIIGMGWKPSEWGGHAMVGVTSGTRVGYLSQTLKPPAFRSGSLDPEIGHYLAEGRRVTAIHLKTSSAFDSDLYGFISRATFGSYNLLSRNCAESVCRSLGAAGASVPELGGVISPRALELVLLKTEYIATVTRWSSYFDLFGGYHEAVTIATYTGSRSTLQAAPGSPWRWGLGFQALLQQPGVRVDGISYYVPY